eukprot:TRINITY_DN2596_c1_g1_i4.p1 TRINITY_DN2596_c1_g1~~TRINITY_DN2596_c1_g1_i4.p1  ORF type:complete len:411 (-),score=125.45 TRINITY_DN2596_c1_g1_i4:101-1333(-)
MDFMSGLSQLSGLDLGSSGSTLTPSFSSSGTVGTNVSQKHALLIHVSGGGLSIDYRFIRRASMHGASYNSIQLIFENHSSDISINNIRLNTSPTNPTSNNLIPFPDIPTLAPKGTTESILSVIFGSVSQSVKFSISTDRGTYPVSLQPSLGELVRPRNMSSEEFDATYKKLGGMNESSAKYKAQSLALNSGVIGNISGKVQEYFNVAPCSIDLTRASFRYAGSALLDEKPFLLSLTVNGVGNKSDSEVVVKVNSENTILASMAAAKLVSALKELMPASTSTTATSTPTSTKLQPTLTASPPTTTNTTTTTTTTNTTPPTTSTATATPTTTTTTATATTKAPTSTKEEDSDSDSDSDSESEGVERKKQEDSTTDSESDATADDDNNTATPALAPQTAQDDDTVDREGYNEL